MQRGSAACTKISDMKIEFLKSGSPDCPLIRLYEFKPSEAQSLRRIALQLARGRIQRVPLHNEQGILAIGGCQLALSREERDRGVFETGPLEFKWALTGAGWLSVSGLIRPFSRTNSGGFQWLSDGGKIGILLSCDGRW
jgi:hypothetical protein